MVLLHEIPDDCRHVVAKVVCDCTDGGRDFFGGVSCRPSYSLKGLKLVTFWRMSTKHIPDLEKEIRAIKVIDHRAQRLSAVIVSNNRFERFMHPS